jgi:hypothetical protein
MRRLAGYAHDAGAEAEDPLGRPRRDVAAGAQDDFRKRRVRQVEPGVGTRWYNGGIGRMFRPFILSRI